MEASSIDIQSFKTKDHLLALIIIFLLSFLVYFQTIHYAYVLDDKIVLTENKYVKKGFKNISKIVKSDSFEGFFGEQKDLLQGARYRPFSIVAFAIEYGLVGDSNSKISHGINIFLYGLLGCIIYLALYLFRIDWPYKKWFLSLPFLVAFLFMLHPIHIEAVANVKGRDELLTMIFSMISMILVIQSSVKRKYLYLSLSSITFFTALMLKENALTFLAVIPAALWVFYKKSLKDLLLPMLFILVPTVLYFLIRLEVIGYLLNPPGKEITDLLNNPFVDMTFSERYATISYTLGQYIKLLFFPHPLTHDFYPYHIPKMNWSDWRVILALAINSGLFVLSLIGLIKRKNWGFFLFFYFATISIVSNILVSIGAFMNDRFAFIPSLAFSALMVIGIEKISSQFVDRKTIFFGIVSIISVLYLAKDYSRIPAWENPYTLNESAIKVSKNSARANCFYGVELYKKANLQKKNEQKDKLLVEAMTYIDRSIEIYPTYTSALKMKAGILGALYSPASNVDDLFEEYHKIMQVKYIPYIDDFMKYLHGRGQHLDKIVSYYHRIGFEHYFRKLRNEPLAISSLEKARELYPNDALILKDLAIVYKRSKRNVARKFALKALESFPDDQELLKILE